MGGAGMCAAIAGCEAGIPAENILIVERNAMAGGNTIFSSSGMNAAWTQYQKEQGIEDSVDLFIEETIAGGHGMNQADLVETMCDGSADTIDWLAGHGLVLDNITTTRRLQREALPPSFRRLPHRRCPGACARGRCGRRRHPGPVQPPRDRPDQG